MKDNIKRDSPPSRNSRPEKALWYQEVLALDPQSRIFLPYAQFLADLDQKDDAIHVLKAGIAKHPEFLEARLLLIQLLHESGQNSAADLEAAGIIELLARFPVLWKIWSRVPGIRADQSALLMFFASCLGQKELNLADVFHAGIEALAARDNAPGSASSAASVSRSAGAAAPPGGHFPEISANDPENADMQRSDTTQRAFVMPDNAPWYALDSVPDDEDVLDDDAQDETSTDLPNSLSLAAHLRTSIPAQAGSPDSSDPGHAAHAAICGKCSLHTRSMAALLEEQGVYAEAANIYRELLKKCSSEEERAELQAKLEALNIQADGSAPPQTDPSAMMAMLEELAFRLENKSRA